MTIRDEREGYCCVVVDGHRCAKPLARRIAARSWVGYIYVCAAHVAHVLHGEPSGTVEPIPGI